MIYDKFKEFAINQDNRNVFSAYHGDLTFIPHSVQNFYRYYNPVDVEIFFNNIVLHFFSAESLRDIQSEYTYLHADLVFATSNGEPYYLLNSKIYTCITGTQNARSELIADNFDEFLSNIIN